MQLYNRTLGQWLEHWAEETPDKEYIVYSDRNLRFTWKQLDRRVDDMAKGLIAIGVERGTHVGIWAANVPVHRFLIQEAWYKSSVRNRCLSLR